MSLFFKLKANVMCYPLKINLENRKILIILKNNDLSLHALKTTFIILRLPIVISLIFVVINFRRRGKVKVMEGTASFVAVLFPTITIIYFRTAYVGDFNSIQNGHIN